MLLALGKNKINNRLQPILPTVPLPHPSIDQKNQEKTYPSIHDDV